MNNKILITILVICSLLLGGLVGISAFPQIKEVEVIKEVPTLIEVPYIVNNTIETEVIVEKEVFNPEMLREDAFKFVLDEYESDLKYCDGEKYSLDEIEWEFEDYLVYHFYDYEDNIYTVGFLVTGDYDNECEYTYDITVEYYKSFEPTVTII